MTAKKPIICIATSIHADFDARVFKHAKAVARMGCDVDLVCPWDPGNVSLPPNLRLVTFKRVHRRPARAPLIPLRMWPLLTARRYDLYHFHDLDMLWFMAMLRFLRRVPVVYDCHENYPEEMLHKTYLPWAVRPVLSFLVRHYERFFVSLVRNVVFVVPSQERTFEGRGIRSLLVRNYAELALGDGRSEDFSERRPACITTASQYIDNGALLLLEVASEVIRRGVPVDFYFVDRFDPSERSLRSRMLEMIARQPLAGRVMVLPAVPPQKIMSLLNRATIGLTLGLATPTLIAGLPTKLFEYMAAGLAIVASDLPTSREVVEDAECGILALPGDPSSFADAIAELASNSRLAKEKGLRGLAAFRSRYNWEGEMGKLQALYESLIPRFPRERSPPPLAGDPSLAPGRGS